MSSLVTSDLRQFVLERANHVCEYCLIHEDDTFYGCHVDHVISLKHGGPTTAENLACACAICNRAKGSDIGSIDWQTGEFCRFYNPRVDSWSEHFRLAVFEIEPLTAIGRVTATILALNSHERILEREALMAVDRFPTPSALAIINR
jgi:hypothetical protein